MSPLHGDNVNSNEIVTRDPTPALNIVENDDEKSSCLSESPQEKRQVSKQGKGVPNLKYSALDYVFWKVLGEGSFSTVFLATDIRLGKEFAIKVCDKRHILRERKAEYMKRERDVINLLNADLNTKSTFFVKLFHTFQDNERLYFVLSYANNGELYRYMSHGKKFDEKCTRFYAAEIVCAMEYMHRLRIIHRDLKPENILLNENMHIVLTDFGSAKVLDSHSLERNEVSFPNHRSRSGSFVGTAQYVSPELLNDQNVCFASDLWALGCIIYQMIEGYPPFYGRSEHEIFQKIRKLELNFTDLFEPKAKDLVSKLLVLDASARLGASDFGKYVSIRSHELFMGVDFEHLHEVIPPLQPISSGEESQSFDLTDPSVRPGLDPKKYSQLLGLSLHDSVSSDAIQPCSKRSISSILNSPEEIRARLNLQSQNNEWHMLVEGNLILRHGLVIKRKGLIPRKCVLLLTTGPHLYYADPVSKVLKGEVPWSSELYEEAKNFKTFFIHTPERNFRWEDPEGNALIWCQAVKQVRVHLYSNNI